MVLPKPALPYTSEPRHGVRVKQGQRDAGPRVWPWPSLLLRGSVSVASPSNPFQSRAGAASWVFQATALL